MKLTQAEFKQYIISEVKKIGHAEGWLAPDSNSEPVNNTVIEESKETVETTESVQENNEKQKDVVLISESIEKLDKILKNDEPWVGKQDTTPMDVKKLNEEFKRMKQLVDFRSPLLIKD